MLKEVTPKMSRALHIAQQVLMALPGCNSRLEPTPICTNNPKANTTFDNLVKQYAKDMESYMTTLIDSADIRKLQEVLLSARPMIVPKATRVASINTLQKIIDAQASAMNIKVRQNPQI